MTRPLLSIVVPLYNEEENVAQLLARLEGLIERLGESVEVECLLVDDHSADRTPELLKDACRGGSPFSFLRLAGNSGSHVAILAGLAHCRGDCSVFLAADLQDPPELIPELIERWQEGYQVVWAVRSEREGISWLDRATARLFYAALNAASETKLPPSGSDFALIDRKVIDAVLESVGANPSLGLEIARPGFRQTGVGYVKAARQAGRSKWNLRRKLKAFADAFVTTSYVPLRLMSYVGIGTSILGFIYALVVIVIRLTREIPVQGWAALMVVTLVFGGIQMIMLGVIGEYLWRTLEQARGRPLYFIEEKGGALAEPEEVESL